MSRYILLFVTMMSLLIVVSCTFSVKPASRLPALYQVEFPNGNKGIIDETGKVIRDSVPNEFSIQFSKEVYHFQYWKAGKFDDSLIKILESIIIATKARRNIKD